MAEQPRTTADQDHGFRKFIMDPKTSVLSYLAVNISQQRPTQQHQIDSVTTQIDSSHAQPATTQNTNQHHSGFSLDPAQRLYQNPGMNAHFDAPNHTTGSVLQTISPQPTSVQPIQNHGVSFGAPNNQQSYVQTQPAKFGASNGASQPVPYPDAPLGYNAAGHEHMLEANHNAAAIQNWYSSQALVPQSQRLPRANNEQSVGYLVLRRLLTKIKTDTPEKPTARLYYRMLLDLESTKFTYFRAKSGKSFLLPSPTFSPSNSKQRTGPKTQHLQPISSRVFPTNS